MATKYSNEEVKEALKNKGNGNGNNGSNDDAEKNKALLKKVLNRPNQDVHQPTLDSSGNPVIPPANPNFVQRAQEVQEEVNAAKASGLENVLDQKSKLKEEVDRQKSQAQETPIPVDLPTKPTQEEMEMLTTELGSQPTLEEPTDIIPAAPVDPFEDIKELERIVGIIPEQRVVKPGETLSRIAEKLGVSVDQLAQWNNIEDPNQIKVGQVLNYGPPPPEPSKEETFKKIDFYGTDEGLNIDLFRALIWRESSNKQSAVSITDVKGIAQMTVKTGNWMFEGTGVKFDVNNMDHQLKAGAKYLAKLIRDWETKGFGTQQAQQLATASYNTGFKRVSEAVDATGKEHPSMAEIETAGLALFKKRFKGPYSAIHTGKDGKARKITVKRSKEYKSFVEGMGHWKAIHYKDGNLIDYAVDPREEQVFEPIGLQILQVFQLYEKEFLLV